MLTYILSLFSPLLFYVTGFISDHVEGREHFKKILDGKKNTAVVSLGDLGESKPVVDGSSELFAGTTGCLKLAREFLDGFGVPFEVVGGNHDLEGIDEFPTDESNMEAYLRILGKPTPQVDMSGHET